MVVDFFQDVAQVVLGKLQSSKSIVFVIGRFAVGIGLGGHADKRFVSEKCNLINVTGYIGVKFPRQKCDIRIDRTFNICATIGMVINAIS